MKRRFETSNESPSKLVAWVNYTLLQLEIDLQMVHWFPMKATPMKHPSVAMWTKISEDHGGLVVGVCFGEGNNLPPEAREDGLIHSFKNATSFEELAIAVKELKVEWGSEPCLAHMLRAAHPRLTADRERYKGAAS